jgi:transcription elongation factor Elf1
MHQKKLGMPFLFIVLITLLIIAVVVLVLLHIISSTSPEEASSLMTFYIFGLKIIDFSLIFSIITCGVITCGVYHHKLGEEKNTNPIEKRISKKLHCPKCGYPQYCGCNSCIDKVPTDYKPWIYSEDGELISCANCGFTMHSDWWLTLEENIFIKSKAADSSDNKTE